MTAALEVVLAPVALATPEAAAAARHVLGRLARLVGWVDPTGPDWREVLGVHRDAPHPVQVGDVAVEDVPAALAGGNTRVLVSMIRRAEHLAAPVFYQLAVRAEASAPFAARLRARFGINTDLLAARLAVVRAHYDNAPDYFLWPAPDQACHQISAMRQARPAGSARTGWVWTDAELTPALSPWERDHLARTAAAFEAAGHRLQARIDGRGRRQLRIPEARGTALFRPRSEHPWHRAAAAAGMFTAVSISGTTYRLMTLSRLLDDSPAQSEGFRLALLGHMVPAHHTYHEVMSASAEHGLPYDPSPAGMVRVAHQLIDRLQLAGGPAGAARDRLANALPTELMALPDELLAAIVRHVGAEDLPSLLLASRRLSAAASGQGDLPAGRALALRHLGGLRDVRGQQGRDGRDGRAATLAMIAKPWAARLLAGEDTLGLGHRRLDPPAVAAIARAVPTIVGLDLSDTSLSSLPAELLAHRELRQLQLRGTEVAALPAAPGGYALQTLHLSAALAAAPRAWVPLVPRLQHLSLMDLGLTALPPELADLSGLQSLRLDDNQLQVLPRWLGEMPALRVLSAGSNRIEAVELAAQFGLAPALDELDLSDNPALTTLTLAAGAAPALSHIVLEGTGLRRWQPASPRPGLRVLQDEEA